MYNTTTNPVDNTICEGVTISYVPHLTALSDADLLGLMIGPQIANELLKTFGTLRTLMEKPAASFTQIHGIGPRGALQLKAAAEIGRRLARPKAVTGQKIDSPGSVANLVMADMRYLTREELRVMVLNTRNEVLGIPTLYRGTCNSSPLDIGEMFQQIWHYETARAFLLVHNHPSGDPTPSSEDVHVTKDINRAAKILNITFLDHIVIGDGRFYSLKERGLGGFGC